MSMIGGESRGVAGFGGAIEALNFSDGSIFNAAMIQVYANWLVQLMDRLQRMEQQVASLTAPDLAELTPQQEADFQQLFSALGANVAALKLRSAKKWIDRMQEREAQ